MVFQGWFRIKEIPSKWYNTSGLYPGWWNMILMIPNSPSHYWLQKKTHVFGSQWPGIKLKLHQNLGIWLPKQHSCLGLIPSIFGHVEIFQFRGILASRDGQTEATCDMNAAREEAKEALSFRLFGAGEAQGRNKKCKHMKFPCNLISGVFLVCLWYIFWMKFIYYII